MEGHRFVIHGDSNSEADIEESFDGSDHDTDGIDSSDEQESLAGEGDNDGDEDSDADEDDDGDDSSDSSTDGESSSDSQSSTDDEDDSIWNSIRDLSWTPKLLHTFDEAKNEFKNQGMGNSEAHQEAYQCVLPKLRKNIISNYVRKTVDAAKLHKDPVHKKIMSTKRKL